MEVRMNINNHDYEIVQNDSKVLYLGNLNTVEFDLKLPKKGQFGSDISWVSGNSKILSDEGKVTRPGFGIGNREVELEATFRYGEAEEKRIYVVTVLEEENQIQVKKQYPMELSAEVGITFYLPEVSVIDTTDGRTIVHAVDWVNGGSRVYDTADIYLECGVLKGTRINVAARVIVTKEPMVIKQKNTAVLAAFEKGEVHLSGDSPFQAAQNRAHEFLLSVDDEQMLYNFRRAAGLDTLGAPEMIGWDSPDGLLRGHTTGHYLSALALCYRAVSDEAIRDKAVYMVKVLGQCQDAFASQGGYHPGFLSAYSEEQFDLLEVYTRYPQIWAPYYTLHKIMAGLLDCYQLIGIDQALEIVSKLGNWVHTRLSGLTHDQRNRMWSMYIAGEFGGMNETMAELYRITGKPQYIETAKQFDNDKLYYPMSIEVDALNGLHANQHIPQMIGALRIFGATGETKYYNIPSFFWSAVTNSHCYAIGGTGEAEMFHAPGRIARQLSKNTAESCATYNMLKLTKELYTYRPDKGYMDYYERAMTNHILATCDCEPNGGTIYFLPLAPGCSKSFDVENSCCHGTGLENHFKYVESIYYHKDNELYVNQFIPSELYWKERNIRVVLSLRENEPGEIDFTFHGSGENVLLIRIPQWCNGTYALTINGRAVSKVTEENGYIEISRTFAEGDIIHISFSCFLHMESSPDVEDLAAVFYGPYCLAAITGESEFLTLIQRERTLKELLVQKENTLEFVCSELGVRFKPLYQIHHETYQVYIKKEKNNT
jgi:DUF1680 family protein